MLKILLGFVPSGPFDHKSSLVQVMAWHRLGDESLPAPMMNQLHDTYVCHKVSMC